MTWSIKIRGDAKSLIAAEYECPIHGRFEITVRRDDVEDAMPCPLVSWSLSGGDKEYATQEDAEEAALAAGIYPEAASYETQRCAETSPWCFPSPARTRVQRVTAMRRGKDPERPPLAIDWESLAYEAKDPAEVQAAERKKTYEELRRRTKGLLR